MFPNFEVEILKNVGPTVIQESLQMQKNVWKGSQLLLVFEQLCQIIRNALGVVVVAHLLG